MQNKDLVAVLAVMQISVTIVSRDGELLVWREAMYDNSLVLHILPLQVVTGRKMISVNKIENIEGENTNELLKICQIHQYFPFSIFKPYGGIVSQHAPLCYFYSYTLVVVL